MTRCVINAKQPGHMAAECNSMLSRKLKMFGFVVPSQGFYSIEVPDKVKSEKFSGLISVLVGEATEEKVADELKNLVNEKWDFQVRKFTSSEYRVAFPDQ